MFSSRRTALLGLEQRLQVCRYNGTSDLEHILDILDMVNSL